MIGPGRRDTVGRKEGEERAKLRGRVRGFFSVVISLRPTAYTVGSQVAVSMVTTRTAELSKCGKLQRQKIKFTLLLIKQKIQHISYFFSRQVKKVGLVKLVEYFFGVIFYEILDS